MKITGFTLLALALLVAGCSMITSWRAIPPPGGCEQCHTQPIGNNWKATYAAATISDETGRNSWQQPESVLPNESSPLEQQKVTEQRCFRCHKSPNQAHVARKGRYHH